MASKEGLGECKIVIYVQIPCFRKGSPKRVCKEALSIEPRHDGAHQGQKTYVRRLASSEQLKLWSGPP
jgi:hypothetical protein